LIRRDFFHWPDYCVRSRRPRVARHPPEVFVKSLLLCCLAGLLLSAGVPAAAAIWLGDYPSGTVAPQVAAVPALPPVLSALGLPLEDGFVPTPYPAALAAPLPPVPEPMLVVMLACGLLLIMPGTWLAEWSRLGDRRQLLATRPGADPG
jgi:hypothetical protein